ncbi:MAG: hypothetical protein HN344_03320 [Gammaproteobacteria bacterium]|jgi:hypothetical protein|nr:hypothetical protein [Gammaproteobacteria bacterium]
MSNWCTLLDRPELPNGVPPINNPLTTEQLTALEARASAANLEQQTLAYSFQVIGELLAVSTESELTHATVMNCGYLLATMGQQLQALQETEAHSLYVLRQHGVPRKR